MNIIKQKLGIQKWTITNNYFGDIFGADNYNNPDDLQINEGLNSREDSDDY